jgi:O-succinylbenzoic acid--CoA ligase
MQTPNWLLRRAERTPDRLALAFGPLRLTFADMADRALALAGALAEAGVGPGERVALWAENGPGFVLSLAASSLLGAVAVPLNTRLTAQEAAFQLADAAPRLLLHDGALADRARAAAAEAGGVATFPLDPVEAFAAGGGSVPVRARIDLGDVHSVVYTSGTSGRPKGALVTYGNLWHGAVAHAMTLGVRTDDRWLACLPLFHVSGLAMLTRSWLYGLGVFVHERFDAARVNAAIDGDGISALSVVATALRRMLDARAHRPYPDTLRLVLVGGGPAPVPLLERAIALGVPVATTYGLTETASQAATLPPDRLAAHLGSAGTALFPTDIRVVREGGGDAAPGEVGEILVRGPTVTPGYLNRPEESRRALRDGWLHTGDLGWLDGEGYLYVADRREDLIVTGGENVYPAEVEAVLLRHPGVAEAAVVGLPDPEWGQAVAAAVVPASAGAVGVEELRAHCAAHLAGYKVPRRWRVVGELPHTASGKLMRGRVRETWPADG